MHDGDAGRVGPAGGPGNQGGVGAEAGQGGGDGVALLARRTVGDVAHRIDGLEGRSAGHQRPPSGEPASGAEKRLDGGEDVGGLGQAPDAPGIGLGHLAGRRPDAADAAPLERGDI